MMRFMRVGALFLAGSGIFLFSLFGTMLVSTSFAAAQSTANVSCPPDEANCGGETGLPKVQITNNTVHTIFQLVFGVIGAVAVLFILIAGIRLITSGGDPEALNNARQTIIYASIGLVVAVSAELLVDFVLTRI